ncbi:MAG: response regulator [Proteobacteria bacterium]|nr:response regulator [Pseudomonadota bacterium]
MSKVLIIEDDQDLRFSLAGIVRKEGYQVLDASSGAEAVDILGQQIVALVYLDIGLPDVDGIDLIADIRDVAPDAEIVMLTGRNDADSAVRSLKAGATDYIIKPFELIEFKHSLSRIMQGRKTAQLSSLAGRQAGMTDIIGESRPVKELRQTIRTAGSVTAPVLIIGETGTGKELVARAIHEHTPGRPGLFVKVDCGTLAAQVIESELFGHDKGAFTDAHATTRGLVEIADGGTLFLDEITNLPFSLQPILLRIIAESVFRRVGGLKDISVDVRIIAASNLNIQQQVKEGNFREDLYYRLNVIPIATPPLRKRGRDVLLLANHFLHKYRMELRKDIKGLSPATEQAFLQRQWPGNVRELKNLIEREVLFSNSRWLSVSRRPAGDDSTAGTEPAEGELQTLAEMELKYIRKVLATTGWNKTRAAKILGISRTTLRDKIS